MKRETAMNVTNGDELAALLERITIEGPFASLDWKWHWERTFGANDGWLIHGSFARADRDTGIVGRGETRREYIARDASIDSAVKTAWVIFELTVRHEAMESFKFDSVLVFDPHRTVAELIRKSV